MRNMTKRRRMLIHSSANKSRLPDEYQEVEYIRATGSQWCTLPYRLGFNGGHFYGLKGDIEALYSGAQSTLWIASNYDASLATYFWGCEIFYGDLRVDTPNRQFIADNELIYTFELNRNNIKINNHLWENIVHEQIYGNNITVGAGINNRGVFEIHDNNVLIKSLIVTIDGETLAEFIPCYRVNDNKAGLFYWIDHAQGTSGFITNSASGSDFIVGPDV